MSGGALKPRVLRTLYAWAILRNLHDVLCGKRKLSPLVRPLHVERGFKKEDSARYGLRHDRRPGP